MRSPSTSAVGIAIYCLFFFTNFGCKQVPKDTESNGFTYVQENKKIDLILGNNEQRLKLGETTEVKFIFSNIDIQNVRILGYGLENVSNSQKLSLWKITPVKEGIIDGKTEITVSEIIESEVKLKKTFYIPVE